MRHFGEIFSFFFSACFYTTQAGTKYWKHGLHSKDKNPVIHLTKSNLIFLMAVLLCPPCNSFSSSLSTFLFFHSLPLSSTLFLSFSLSIISLSLPLLFYPFPPLFLFLYSLFLFLSPSHFLSFLLSSTIVFSSFRFSSFYIFLLLFYLQYSVKVRKKSKLNYIILFYTIYIYIYIYIYIVINVTIIIIIIIIIIILFS